MEKDTKNLSLQEKLELIDREFPIVMYTGSSRLITTIRRMREQENLGIPVEFRFGNAISTQNGLYANKMTDEGWHSFFNNLKGQLKRDYPDSYKAIFPEEF